MEQQQKAVSVKQASRILGVSAHTVRGAVYRGEIPSFRVGRRVLIPVAVLDRLLSGNSPECGKEAGGAD